MVGVSTTTSRKSQLVGELFGSTRPLGFAGGDENLRRYVGNHPTYATDPTGLAERISIGVQIIDATKKGVDPKAIAEAQKLADEIFDQADVDIDFNKIIRLDPKDVAKAIGDDFRLNYQDPGKGPHTALPGECEKLRKLIKVKGVVTVVIVDDLVERRQGDFDGRPFGITLNEKDFPGISIVFVKAIRPAPKDVARTLAHELYHYITMTMNHMKGTLMENVPLGKEGTNILTGAQCDALRKGIEDWQKRWQEMK